MRKVDKLDNAIKQLSEVSEDYECNQCKADMLDLMRELKHWRENPFRMIYRGCKKRTTAPGCKKCPWYQKYTICCQLIDNIIVPVHRK